MQTNCLFTSHLQNSFSVIDFKYLTILQVKSRKGWKFFEKRVLSSAFSISSALSLLLQVAKYFFMQYRRQQWYEKFIFSNFHKFPFADRKKKCKASKRKSLRRLWRNLMLCHLHDVIKLDCWLALFIVNIVDVPASNSRAINSTHLIMGKRGKLIEAKCRRCFRNKITKKNLFYSRRKPTKDFHHHELFFFLLPLTLVSSSYLNYVLRFVRVEWVVRK